MNRRFRTRVITNIFYSAVVTVLIEVFLVTNVSLIATYMDNAGIDNFFISILVSFDVVVILMYVLFGILVFTVTFMILQEKSLRYITKISDAMQNISEGDLNVTVEVEGDDEFSSMAANLNKMVEDLKELMDKERESERTKNELITNVAHDLRTPLTSIIGYLTLLEESPDLPVDVRARYTGITLAEYYRDMGYDVAMMADSTSRWAEALREISGRLEEMPAEEGFPAYLPSRLAAFYERAGCVQSLSGAAGSVSIIGAVSPQGSDFSEPVTQNTKRFVRCFLALDKSLAYARHYPAINWTMSYSEYYEDLDPYYTEHLGEKFCTMRGRILGLLSEENKLMEIVKLIGSDVLPDSQKVVIETARVIRTGFLQQNAFHKNDTYVPLDKQMWMMEAILHLYDRAVELVDKGVPVSAMAEAGLFDKLVKVKYEIPNDKPEMFGEYNKELDDMCAQLLAKQTPAAG